MKLGPWRYFTFALAVIYLVVVVVLPTLALIVAAFRKFLFIRSVDSLFDMRQYSLDSLRAAVRQSAGDALDLEHDGGRADHGAVRRRARLRDRLHRQPHAGRRAAGASTSSPRCQSPSRASSIGVAYLWAWIGLPGGLYGTIWILALAFIARFMPDTVKALSTSLLQIHQRAGGSLLDLRQGPARHHPHHRAAARAPGRHRRDDAAVHPGDPRARLVAVPLHQRTPW